MSLPTITGTGRLTKDPEVRYTSSGKAATSLSLAFNSRKKNPQTGEWEDGDVCFLNATAWEQLAEHLGAFRKGDELIVWGRLRQRSYETRDGEKRTVVELLLDAAGPSVRFKEARLVDTGVPARKSQTPAEADPWGTAPAPDPTEAPF